MLSVRNIVDESALPPEEVGIVKSSFMNGICTYKDFGFPYFSNIYFNNELQVEMPLLSRDTGYQAAATIYGRNAVYSDIGASVPDGGKAKVYEVGDLRAVGDVYKLNYDTVSQNVDGAKIIMLTITLDVKNDSWPWGVYKMDSIGD